MKKFITIATLASMLALSGSALAERGRHHRMEHPLANPQVVEKLGLSDNQQAQIQELLERFRADNPKPEKADRQARHDQMKALMEADSFDEARARALLAPRQERQLKQMKLRFDLMKVLTPEQRAELKELRHQRRHRRHHKHD
ncbi:periplasmic heavy metal sensor [Gallaecimonas sp. GXIMD4217]|uniref:Spy/CpxP family protein refolding chaperone n=1 Tax=Gallaecimonas sp. GXIMD4217 TaxID=3131927 RepID=UPI00311B33F0